MCIYIINDNNVITNPWWKYTLSTPKQKYSSFWAHHCIADLATLVAIGSATAKRKPCGFFFWHAHWGFAERKNAYLFFANYQKKHNLRLQVCFNHCATIPEPKNIQKRRFIGCGINSLLPPRPWVAEPTRDTRGPTGSDKFSVAELLPQHRFSIGSASKTGADREAPSSGDSTPRDGRPAKPSYGSHDLKSLHGFCFQNGCMNDMST